MKYVHNRSKMKTLQHSIAIIGKFNHKNLMPNYANLVIEIIELYMNCGMIAVFMGIILSMTDEHCSKA